MIAAIGPVVTENDELVKQLADIAELPTMRFVDCSPLSNARNSCCVAAGSFGSAPDVLADHLLYIAAVDELGRPTGFVDRMVTLFRPSLENILANAAELDWRSETVDGPILSCEQSGATCSSCCQRPRIGSERNSPDS